MLLMEDTWLRNRESTHIRRSRSIVTSAHRGDAWTHPRLTWRPVEASGVLYLHQTCNREVAVRSSSNDGINIKRRSTIKARSPRDRGHNQARFWSHQNGNHGHNHRGLMATIIVQSWPPIGTQSWIKRPEFFGRKSSLKTDVFPLIW